MNIHTTRHSGGLIQLGISIALLISAFSAPIAGVVGAASAQTVPDDSCRFGLADNFAAGPAEPAEPSSTLQAALNRTLLNFDQCQTDRYFGHTIDRCLLDRDSIKVQLRLKCAGGTPSTDILYLGTNGVMHWGLRMTTLYTLFGGPNPPYSSGDTVTLVLNLDRLPPSDNNPSYGPSYPSGVTEVRTWVRADRHLDIVVADDTCVDYIQVDNPDPTPTWPTTWGRVKGRYR